MQIFDYELYHIATKGDGYKISKLSKPSAVLVNTLDQRIDIEYHWNNSVTSPGTFLDVDSICGLKYFSNNGEISYCIMKAIGVISSTMGNVSITFETIVPDYSLFTALVNSTFFDGYIMPVSYFGQHLISQHPITDVIPRFTSDTTKDDIMKTRIMPFIDKIYYNEPHTAVKWTDGTTTVVGCADGEEFSKELGLSVAIAKKYFEILGFPYPRATLKHFAEEKGCDQTAKTKARRDFKAAKKLKNN